MWRKLPLVGSSENWNVLGLCSLGKPPREWKIPAAMGNCIRSLRVNKGFEVSLRRYFQQCVHEVTEIHGIRNAKYNRCSKYNTAPTKHGPFLMLTSYFCLLSTISQKRAENLPCAAEQGLFCVSAASSTCHSWSFEQKSPGWSGFWEWKEEVSSNADKGFSSQHRDTQKLQWISNRQCSEMWTGW